MTQPGRNGEPEWPLIPVQRSASPEFLDSSDRDPEGYDEWSYDYRGKRGAAVSFTGHLIYIGGEAGERLLGELGAVLRDLLEWAYDQQQSEGQDDDSE
jgi:hypothetical protein